MRTLLNISTHDIFYLIKYLPKEYLSIFENTPSDKNKSNFSTTETLLSDQVLRAGVLKGDLVTPMGWRNV